jgi:8-oxo-dGTP diphosphatase
MTINSDLKLHTIKLIANVLLRQGDTYLVIKRSADKDVAPGMVHSVGGHVDHGESPYDAAIREVKEETGLDLSTASLRVVVTEIKKDAPDWTIFHFLAEIPEHAQIPTSCDEGEFLLLSKEELISSEMLESYAHVLSTYFSNSSEVTFLTFRYDESGALENAQ